MKRPPQPGFLLTAARELRWMRRDRLALFLAVGVPLIAFAILAATFSNAVIRNLNVTVADADNTATSQLYVQAIASSPIATVTHRSISLTDAMHAVRSGTAIAAVYIPPNFERDSIAGRRPQITLFYNRQFFTPGNNASAAISRAVNAATEMIAPASHAKPSVKLGSLEPEEYVLTNPALNFAQFLLRAVMPMVLHVVIAIAAGYAVGSEFRRRSVKAWLRAAGGSPLTALLGKLAPLFGIFMIMLALEAAIIHGVFQVPFRGSSIMMGGAACLLVLAYLGVGAFFQLLVRDLSLGLSLTALFCSPAFGFAGVGFPLIGINGFARLWGDLLPLRWYTQVLFDQAVRGVPVTTTAEPFAVLGGLGLIYLAAAWLRLRAASTVRAQRPAVSPREVVLPAPRGVGGAMITEFRKALMERSAFGLILLGPVLYGIFYPQPYLGQVLRDIPMAVVDQDRTELSRTITQALNAHEAIEVALSTNTLAQAKAALHRREVYGVVAIPPATEREVLKGNEARLGVYVDSAYFLLYNRTLQGVSEASATVNADVAARGARSDGSLARAALTKSAPVELVSEPLFNPTGGYANYVVPAAFVLIIQQTLLMGCAMLGGVTFEAGGARARQRRASPQAVLGQALAHLCLALPGLALYLIILPRIYGFSTLGHLTDLILFAIPFVLAVSMLAQFVGSWFTRKENAVLLFIATSLPLFFLVGIAWPLEAIPPALRMASAIFPSTAAIDGLVRINQMGASLHDVFHDWITLWALTAVYAVLAVISGHRTTGKEVRHAG